MSAPVSKKKNGKIMNLHLADSEDAKPKPQRQRCTVALRSRLASRVRRYADRSGDDLSDVLAQAVEAVYGRGPRYVRLRSNARGLARLLMLHVLYDNRINSLARHLAQSGGTGFSADAARHVALARLEEIHRALGELINVIDSWRRHDESAAEQLLAEGQGDLSHFENGDGI